MKILLLLGTLLSFMLAGELQNELLEAKQVLAKKHDYSKKTFKNEKQIRGFQKLSKEELMLQEAISKSSGLVINEDKPSNNKKQGK